MEKRKRAPPSSAEEAPRPLMIWPRAKNRKTLNHLRCGARRVPPHHRRSSPADRLLKTAISPAEV
jgi:hypothetical protein